MPPPACLAALQKRSKKTEEKEIKKRYVKKYFSDRI
jgi:hypothetical protein